MPFEFKSFGRVVAVVYDVEGLGRELRELSLRDPGCVEYHLKEGHISSWLRSIGEYPLAESLRSSSTASQAAEVVNKYLARKKSQGDRSPSRDATVCRNIRLTG